MLSGEAQNNSPASRQQPQTTAVDVAEAKKGTLVKTTLHLGTTYPAKEISLRSRAEGTILDLNVDVGDRIEKGQILARIDNSLNRANILEEEAELAALQSEVTSLEAEANEGLTQIKQSKITLEQAKSDLVRANNLVKEGAITQQAAEQAQNDLDNAQQALFSAEQEVANRTSAVTAARKRVTAQKAIVAQERQLEAFTMLVSPITGSVLERVTEPGDFARVGDEILQLGDFSQIQVRSQISELDLSQIQLGQTASITLDAFPEERFIGEVTQIALAANRTTRLIPVEVTIANPGDRIGGGLLARVNFAQKSQEKIIIPETAIKIMASENSSDRATVFVIEKQAEQVIVRAREVSLGKQDNSQVEILSGLEPGERYVVRSSGNLEDGDVVRLSFLSN